MPYGIHRYLYYPSRLARSLASGFALRDGAFETEEDSPYRTVFLAALDSGQEDCPWGRLTFRMSLGEDTVLTLHAAAANENRVQDGGRLLDIDAFLLDPGQPVKRKARLFQAMGAAQFSNQNDVLLYGQKGRYLWLWFELAGEGGGRFSHISVTVPGDNFLHTFPAVYQNQGEFLHRYLSVFSSLYADLQDEIERLPQYLDPDTAPAGLLPVFARWLGIELDGNFLDEEHLRRLVKLAPELIACKGTRRAVQLIVGLFVTGKTYLIEHNLLNREQLAAGSSLGDGTIYDFSLLISQEPDELLLSRLRFLIDQFKPLRSRANIIFLGSQGNLDDYSYLDLNAMLLQPGARALDDKEAVFGMVRLEE